MSIRYWKSNPYLTSKFTGEDDSLHPQWVVINLEKPEPVNAIRIAWAEPYARVYQVQYWVGDGDAMDEQDKGAWKTFASGEKSDGKGGTETLHLDPAGVSSEISLRVLMTQSSNTCDTHGSGDPRNCVGYAIRELYLGTLSNDGQFSDMLHHSARSETDADLLLVGRSRGTRLRISTLRLIAWNPATSPALTFSFAAESRAVCRRSFPSRCSTARRKTAPRKCLTSKNAAIRFQKLRWAKSRTVSTCSPKTTPRFICNLPPRCIASIPASNLAARFSKA